MISALVLGEPYFIPREADEQIYHPALGKTQESSLNGRCLIQREVGLDWSQASGAQHL